MTAAASRIEILQGARQRMAEAYSFAASSCVDPALGEDDRRIMRSIKMSALRALQTLNGHERRNL